MRDDLRAKLFDTIRYAFGRRTEGEAEAHDDVIRARGLGPGLKLLNAVLRRTHHEILTQFINGEVSFRSKFIVR